MPIEEEFEKQEQQLYDFMESSKKRIHNGGITGSRKTTTTICNIAFDIHNHPDHRWVIAVPLHKIIEGADNILDWCKKNGLEAVEIWGKSSTDKDDNLIFDNYEEKKCLVKKCGACKETGTCGYYNQAWDSQIIVCAYEMLPSLRFKIGEFDKHKKTYIVNDWFGLVMEEEPTRFWMKEMKLNKTLVPHVKLSTRSKTYRDYWGKGTDYRFTEVMIRDFKPKTLIENRLYDMKKYCKDLQVHTYKGITTLFGSQKYMVPSYFKKVIFNCATTPDSYRDLIFNNSSWEKIGIKEKISNPVISIGYHWGKTNTGNRIGELKRFVNFFKGNGKKILLITKQFVETDLGIDVDIVHYNSGRGFNNFNKPYDLVIVYGNFKLTPLERLKRVQLGISETTIDVLENAEVLQSMNRFRPYSHADTPVILMTQHIEDYTKESWTTVPDKVLHAYNDFPYEHEKNMIKSDVMEDYTKWCYAGLISFVTWCRKWVFKSLSVGQQILQSKIEGKTIKQIAARVEVSEWKVKKVVNNFLSKYGDTLSKYKKRIFELDI